MDISMDLAMDIPMGISMDISIDIHAYIHGRHGLPDVFSDRFVIVYKSCWYIFGIVVVSSEGRPLFVLESFRDRSEIVWECFVTGLGSFCGWFGSFRIYAWIYPWIQMPDRRNVLVACFVF